jgi:hypothetical protein
VWNGRRIPVEDGDLSAGRGATLRHGDPAEVPGDGDEKGARKREGEEPGSEGVLPLPPADKICYVDRRGDVGNQAMRSVPEAIGKCEMRGCISTTVHPLVLRPRTYLLATLVSASTSGYQYYGTNFYSPYGAAELDLFAWDFIYPGNGQGFTATLSVIPWEHVTVYADYLTGQNLSNRMPLTEYEVGVMYNFTPGGSVKVLYRDLTMGGIDQQNTLRAMFDYRF